MCNFCEEGQKISWESNRDICQIGNFSIDRHYYNNTLFADSSGGEYASAMLKIKFCPLCGKNLEEQRYEGKYRGCDIEQNEVIDISELHDTFEKISDATKVLIVGKQIDAIGKMISAIAEAQIQNELEQKYKDLGIQEQEDPVAKLLETINEMHFGDNFPIECLEPPKQDISTLKKRIKYCKNPMEKKKLEQELNALYKEHKRNRRTVS